MERIALAYTDRRILPETYRNLPERGVLELRVPRNALEESLHALEETGFCALLAPCPRPADVLIRVEAYKGKQGPCYDAGRKAKYLGAARAALDDDNHLLIAGRALPVCEKTAAVYGFPPYHDLVSCSSASPVLQDRLETDPVVFDCNTFEDDMKALSGMFRHQRPEMDRCLLYYPGPFRFLFLQDGSVVRRGRVNNVPATLRDRLMLKENFIECTQEEADMHTASRFAAGPAAGTAAEPVKEQATEAAGEGRGEYPNAIKPLFFNDIYHGAGPAWFTVPGFTSGANGENLETTHGVQDSGFNGTIETTPGVQGSGFNGTLETTHAAWDGETPAADLSVLAELKTALKGRLTDVIRNNRKYFILTGSEPEDELGCCPSDEVAEAGILVRAGILSRYAQPLPEDACPLTTFAFRNEMKVSKVGLHFTPDPSFRREVLKRLTGKSRPLPRNIMRYVLLVFVLASLAIALYRLADGTSSPPDASLFEQLGATGEDDVMVILFHFRERCEICLNMEQYTRGLLQDYPHETETGGNIRFRTVVINDDGNVNLVKRFNIYTSTLLLAGFENGEETQVRVLSDGWQLYRDEAAFRAMLSHELDAILATRHE